MTAATLHKRSETMNIRDELEGFGNDIVAQAYPVIVGDDA